MKAIDRAVQKCGSQQALAEKIQVTQALVSQWVNEITGIDVKHFQPISDATDGDVTPADLLADEMAKHTAAGSKGRRAANER